MLEGAAAPASTASSLGSAASELAWAGSGGLLRLRGMKYTGHFCCDYDSLGFGSCASCFQAVDGGDQLHRV